MIDPTRYQQVQTYDPAALAACEAYMDTLGYLGPTTRAIAQDAWVAALEWRGAPPTDVERAALDRLEDMLARYGPHINDTFRDIEVLLALARRADAAPTVAGGGRNGR